MESDSYRATALSSKARDGDMLPRTFDSEPNLQQFESWVSTRTDIFGNTWCTVTVEGSVIIEFSIRQ